ncbi:DUF4367 domain-containing protein [Oribacterium sinus]|uniref:DUF4367 domain-containing protein n=1 Tax=Oribacterium sinus TaxID=237576 RepID=UPI0028F0C217|nr:DUF4367 domain-containing protein [Oribacterium sinus]
MKEDSKRLLRGMTEVSDQYILEAEAFYQKKDEQNVDRENAVKEIKGKESIEEASKENQEKEYQYKECNNEEGGNRESIEKEKKIIKMQEAKKRKFITLPRVLGFTASIAAACFVCYIGVFMFFAPRAAKPSSVMLEGAQGEDSGGTQDKAEEFAAENGELKENSAGITAKGRSVEEVESMQQATELTGFTMRIPEGKAPYTEKTISVIGEDMIEVAYSKEEPFAIGYSIRKARAEGDISGDFTEYSDIREVDFEGRKVTLKGKAGTYSLALWEENGFSYAVKAQEKPMTEEEILEIVKAVE